MWHDSETIAHKCATHHARKLSEAGDFSVTSSCIEHIRSVFFTTNDVRCPLLFQIPAFEFQ